MSNVKTVLIGVGIIALILLVLKFRVLIVSKLPFLSEATKSEIIAKDPFTHFEDQKDTFQVIDHSTAKVQTLDPIPSLAQIGLIGEQNDNQNSVTDLKREFMEGDWVGITQKQISDAMFGKAEQKTTVNDDGIVETKQVKEDKLLGATFDEVSKNVSTAIDKVLEPFQFKISGKVLSREDKASATKVVTIGAINRFTGEIAQVDANNIPEGYIVIGA